jgi:hypothetical protein
MLIPIYIFRKGMHSNGAWDEPRQEPSYRGIDGTEIGV